MTFFQKFVDDIQDTYQDVLHVFSSNDIPKPGDMIQFQMPFFQHWGIYVGDGNVVHFGWPAVRLLPFEYEVRKDHVKEVSLAISFGVYNKFDKYYPPLPPERVVKRAEYMVGKTMRYYPGSANCEHFATMMRYDITRSGQAERFYFHVDPDFVKQIKRWLAEINE